MTHPFHDSGLRTVAWDISAALTDAQEEVKVLFPDVEFDPITELTALMRLFKNANVAVSNADGKVRSVFGGDVYTEHCHQAYLLALMSCLAETFSQVTHFLTSDGKDRVVVLLTPLTLGALKKRVFAFSSHCINLPIDSWRTPITPKITLSGLSGVGGYGALQ